MDHKLSYLEHRARNGDYEAKRLLYIHRKRAGRKPGPVEPESYTEPEYHQDHYDDLFWHAKPGLFFEGWVRDGHPNTGVRKCRASHKDPLAHNHKVKTIRTHRDGSCEKRWRKAKRRRERREQCLTFELMS